MPKRFTVTVPDEYVDALEWVLSAQQERNPDEAPKTVKDLVQAAVEGLVLKPYLAQQHEDRIRTARLRLGKMSPAERVAVLSSIEGTKGAS